MTTSHHVYCRLLNMAKHTSRDPVSDAEALDLVMQLMAIPGRSGDETAVADFVRGQLVTAGIPASSFQLDDAHRRTPIGGQLGNLVLKLPGTVRGPRRMLSAHLDTVPICVGSRPVRKRQKH
jgi:tripeptide aminopeptidase